MQTFKLQADLILLGLVGASCSMSDRPGQKAATTSGRAAWYAINRRPALLTALLILVDTVGLVFTLVALLANLGLVALAFWNADWFTRC